MTEQCQFMDECGVCGVVREQAGITVKPRAGFCRACHATDTPETGDPNHITTTLAFGAIKQQQSPEAAAEFANQWSDLLDHPTARIKNTYPQGPGTELAFILKRLGVPGCTKCDQHATRMNKEGCDWCEINEELILGWLKDSAHRRGLPFIKIVARRLLRKAIRSARKKEQGMSTSDKIVCICDHAGMCPRHQAIVSADQLQQCRAKALKVITDPKPCMHMREQLSEGVYKCSVHGKCQPERGKEGIAVCSDCDHNLPLDSNHRHIRKKWTDGLNIVTPDQTPTHALRGLLKDRAAFLVLGGPSGRDLPLEKLQERGIWSMGVNNVAGRVRTNAFVCADPPSKFHNGIWTDPAVMKFIPIPKLRTRRGRLREKTRKGEFKQLGISCVDCPNVWGFSRRSWLSPDDSWFLNDSAAWGNHNAGTERTGQPKTVGTMLLGIRLLQYLGARQIFLVGCDFYMDPKAGQHDNYSFGEERDKNAVSSCNSQYRIMNEWLVQLRPVFEKFGFFCYNCNQHSRLSAFDYVPFSDALEVVRGNCPKEPYSLDKWYEK